MKLFSIITTSITLAVSTLTFSTVNHADNVKLTSLDWPPYTSNSLKDQGASVAVAKAAFKAAGHTLTVNFYPWKRAVNLAKTGDGYDGYFPEYFAEELKNDFILSNPMGSGPLGFAELKSAPVQWNNLKDLMNHKVGVVSGYVNTADFDKAVAEGKIKASAAGDDVKNLMKLSASRIELAVIDKHVLSFLLKSDAKLTKIATTIQFNQKMLEDKQLYICFTKGSRGQKLAKAFNEGLTQIDIPSIMQSYLGN